MESDKKVESVHQQGGKQENKEKVQELQGEKKSEEDVKQEKQPKVSQEVIETKDKLQTKQQQKIKEEKKDEQQKTKEETKDEQQKSKEKKVVENQNQNENQDDQANNQQNWTDATSSVAADQDLQIVMLDDDIINQMQMDSEEGEQDDKQEYSMKSDEEKLSQAKMKEEQNLADLQDQFVTGGQSDQTFKLGKHDKFCTSLGIGNNMIFTGGGDDRLLCFKQNEGKWEQFYELKHSQTVSKIEVSHDGKYVVSLTDNELYCTDIGKLQSLKVEINEPTDVVCHKSGGVLATSHQFSVSIYNLKGLELYATYNLDQPATNLIFSQNGKQIITACQNKLRIITPKTGEILKAAGGEFHKEEISTLGTVGNVTVSGCIGGEVYVTSLTKGNILGRLDPFKGSINCIFTTQHHSLIAPQGEGVHWTDINKFKRIFHAPTEISASAIVRVHSPYNYAISDIEGNIHIVDYRTPLKTIVKLRAGNSIHSLQSKGSHLYAACQDGYARVFDLTKVL